jgi:uncharacterized Fe-S radical SAM superfamily protein PflX
MLGRKGESRDLLGDDADDLTHFAYLPTSLDVCLLCTNMCGVRRRSATSRQCAVRQNFADSHNATKDTYKAFPGAIE